MMPPPRGMFTSTVATLDVCVPALLLPATVADTPLTPLAVTVTGVLKGIFVHRTTTGTGFVCCAGTTIAGLAGSPDGFVGTGEPAMLSIVNCTPWPGTGMMMGWN